MNDEAKYVYEEELRLIAEDEKCAVEAAHFSAELMRIDARRRYIRSQKKHLLASLKRSEKALAADASKTSVTNITMNVNANATADNAPTYNQHGDGGQYVADNIFTIPNLKQ